MSAVMSEFAALSIGLALAIRHVALGAWRAGASSIAVLPNDTETGRLQQGCHIVRSIKSGEMLRGHHRC
jgi:hypothetical protein